MTLAELRQHGYTFNIGPDGYTVWHQAEKKRPTALTQSLLREPVKMIAQAKEGCANPGAEAHEKATIHHFMLTLEK